MKNSKQQEVWEKFYGPNIGYIYEQYEQYLENPDAIDPAMKALFDESGSPSSIKSPSLDNQSQQATTVAQQQQLDFKKISAAWKLLKNIRIFGHLAADLNPIKLLQPHRRPNDTHFLNIESNNLTKKDLLEMPVTYLWEDAPPHIHNGWEAYQFLKNAYSGKVAYEFEHIHDEEERKWLEDFVEQKGVQRHYSDNQRITLLNRLIQVDNFERFLHKTFVGQKRFSIEGLDMVVPMLDKVIEESGKDKTENIMIGMAHRGRLNVLAHVLGKPYERIFSEFHHAPNKELVPSEGSTGINFGWSGDVKYHLGAEHDVEGVPNHRTIHIRLANNPSHLEFVNPVVLGMTRASQENRQEHGIPKQNKETALAVLIHGDAAFPGEGVVAETLNVSRLKGYDTGGTIHIIANNMIGFTTDYDDSRSTRYASDLAKGYEIPIIHVNADDPESCLDVIVFANEYRKKFHKDILLDLIGYRRYGHNEMDDPAATQPQLYEIISQHKRIAEKYGSELVAKGILSEKAVHEKIEDNMKDLQQVYEEFAKNEKPKTPMIPRIVVEGVPSVDTAVSKEFLEKVNKSLLNQPSSFTVYPKLERILNRRNTALSSENKIDWALAESLAFASILADGIPIRLTGQDSERGTFAHRHLVLHDYKTNERLVPLQNIPEAKAAFSIYNSPLSEAAVLGYEYGYSVKAQDALVLWEAQFGDFANAAQVLIDQFISSGYAKWGQKSSLVMLLPHGYEGQGSEHSSARLERFLELSAENNWIVANVTSASQYFHLLRRQALLIGTESARPLVLMTPKSLLRHPLTGSSSADLSNGRFLPLLEQEGTGRNTEKVKRLILCSGKVAIDLAAGLEQLPSEQVESLHIARVEQLYPFPKKEVEELITRFSNLAEVVWVQEEPRNMGPWPVIQTNLAETIDKHIEVRYIGRQKKSSPATGDPIIHKQEQNMIIQDALQFGKGGENND
ncbi:2-oxoglutarate dehydrogenase E1 component [Schinkia sp. CFF1]